jgi:hypothetical protein
MQAEAAGADWRSFDGVRRAIGAVAHPAAIGSLSGMIAGAVAGGGGGRLAMRITGIMATDAEQGTLTDADQMVGNVTFDGSIELMVFGGMLFGILGGLFYAAMRRWLADAGPWRGLAFGATILFAGGWVLIDSGNADFPFLGSATVNILMFASIFVLFGALVSPVFEWMRGILGPPAVSIGGVVSLGLHAFGVFLAAMMAGAAGSGFGEGEARGAFIAVASVWLLLVMPIGAWWVAHEAGSFERLSDLRSNVRARSTALVLLAVPIIVGLAITLYNVVDIYDQAG